MLPHDLSRILASLSNAGVVSSIEDRNRMVDRKSSQKTSSTATIVSTVFFSQDELMESIPLITIRVAGVGGRGGFISCSKSSWGIARKEMQGFDDTRYLEVPTVAISFAM
jgi:hypothetical protein